MKEKESRTEADIIAHRHPAPTMPPKGKRHDAYAEEMKERPAHANSIPRGGTTHPNPTPHHSIHSEYKRVKYLGVYNPRMNLVTDLAWTAFRLCRRLAEAWAREDSIADEA